MMTKKLLALLLSLLLVLSLLTACGGPAEENNEKEEQQSTAVPKDNDDAEDKELFGFSEGADKEEAPEETPAVEDMPALDAAPAEPEDETVSEAVDADYYVLAGTFWYYGLTEDVLVFHEDGTVELYNPETGSESTLGEFTWSEANEEGSINVGEVVGVMYFAGQGQYLSVESVDNAWFFETYTGDLSEFN